MSSLAHLVAALLPRPHVEHEDRVKGSARQQVQVADVVEEARRGGLQADQVRRKAAVVGLLIVIKHTQKKVHIWLEHSDDI